VVGAAVGAAMLITGFIFIRRRRRRQQQDNDAESAYAASFGVDGFRGTSEDIDHSENRSSHSDWLSILRRHRQRPERQSEFMREIFSE
jgi:hypothetical protein